jgi:hypothetical protein
LQEQRRYRMHNKIKLDHFKKMLAVRGSTSSLQHLTLVRPLKEIISMDLCIKKQSESCHISCGTGVRTILGNHVLPHCVHCYCTLSYWCRELDATTYSHTGIPSGPRSPGNCFSDHVAHFTYIHTTRLVWCPRQNKRIAPLSFFHGCRKRRLKE